jgi:hypothetical protein
MVATRKSWKLVPSCIANALNELRVNPVDVADIISGEKQIKYFLAQER